MATATTADPLRSWLKLRSQIANAVRDGAPEEQVAELRRLYAVARLETVLRTGLEALPPLSQEERARLAAILTEPRRRRLAS